MNYYSKLIMNMTVASIFHDITSISPFVKRVVPNLTRDFHKGEMGRIGVIGGSKDYTGAPFYAAKSSLLFGGDLASIFCAQTAAIPLKCYSPEVMVTPWYNDDNIDHMPIDTLVRGMLDVLGSYLTRLHCVVIGPGMGRNPAIMKALPHVLSRLIASNIPLVIDADGLYMVSRNLSVIRGYSRCVLTPNANEFRMLVNRAAVEIKLQLEGSVDIGEECRAGDSIGNIAPDNLQFLLQELTLPHTSTKADDMSDDTQIRQLRALCEVLQGVTVMLKGPWDSFCTAGRQVVQLKGEGLEGSPRRCGGQGDILAGSVAVALHWAERHDEVEKEERFNTGMTAAMLASIVVRRASSLAFAKKGRSMTSPDILDNMGDAFIDVLGE